MPQVYILDNVIRKVSEADACKITSSPTKKLVIIDAKSKQVLEKKPRITIGRQLEFFLVSNENDPRNFAKSRIIGCSIKERPGDHSVFSFTNDPTDRSVGISIKYEVSCPPGNEEKVALALFDYNANTPGSVFEGKLINWLNDYTSRQIKFSDFKTNYTQHLNELQIDAVGRAREVGLTLIDLKLSFDLGKSNRLTPFSVTSNDFPVLLNDFEEEVNFRFRTNLSIADNGKVNAILSYGQLVNLKDILQKAVQHYCRQYVSLYDFCYDFEESVRKGLVANLDQVLAPHGRKIEGFFPPPDFASHLLMPEPEPIQFDVKHEIQGYGSVLINNKLEVEPERHTSGRYSQEGILKYRKSRITDIKSWFKDRLEKTIHRCLFDFSYVDIILKYIPQTSKTIKAQLDKEAERIGYSIRLITTVPDLKPIKLSTEGFKFEANETFSTKQNSVKIKLGIDVRGKIENLESIKDILNDPQNDVNGLIENEIIDSIKRVLQGVEPADFYAQEGLISYLNDYSSEVAIKNKVAETIEDSLKEKFGATILQVTLQALNTELLELINKLTGKAFHSFEVRTASVRDAGEPVQFTGSFQINGVVKDKWDTFASCKPSVEDVREFLQNQLRYWFSSLSTRTLSYETTQELLKILTDANTLASKDIINSFGLLISIHRFELTDTALRIAQREIQSASNIKTIKEAQEQIENDDQLREIEKNISLNDMKHLNQTLESVRGLLRDLSTQTGGEERKKKLIEKEEELKNQLSELVEDNRKRSAEITSQKMQQSIKPSTDESDFDDLVQNNRALLTEESAKLDSKAADKNLPGDNPVIDV